MSFMGLLYIDWVMPGPVVHDPRASSEEQLVAPPWHPRGEERPFIVFIPDFNQTI